jgi:hypothetical protein
MQVNPTTQAEDRARAFLKHPTEAGEAELIAALNDSLKLAGYDPHDDGFIEWGCVEHGVIHWCVAMGQQWIQFVPGGFIETL